MSCFDVPEQQLYLLELTVESLKLTPEKIYDCGKRPLLVKIKFLSLPIFEISPSEFESVSESPGNETTNGSLIFSSSRSCLFGKRPEDLVREMQTTPLRIGIFCAGETYPIAEATLPLSGCLCDQIAMAMNDPQHLPEPYVLHGSYGLHDPGENPSGNLSMNLKITCLGKYVTTHYQMRQNSFVFKSDRDEEQYFVKRVLQPGEGDDEAQKVVDVTEEIPQDTETSKSNEKTGKKKEKQKKKMKK